MKCFYLSRQAEEYLPVKDVWPVTSKKFSQWRHVYSEFPLLSRPALKYQLGASIPSSLKLFGNSLDSEDGAEVDNTGMILGEWLSQRLSDSGWLSCKGRCPRSLPSSAPTSH